MATVRNSSNPQIHQGCTKPWRLFDYILCGGANITSDIDTLFSPLLTKTVNQFTRTEQKASDKSEVHRSLQNFGYSAWNLLYVIFLTPELLRSFPDLSKICRFMLYTTVRSLYNWPLLKCTSINLAAKFQFFMYFCTVHCDIM